MTTKDKILQAALKLFNLRGVSNVTIRDIAAAVNISPGNLVYHFKNTDIILATLFEKMEAERNDLRKIVDHEPTFENINRQLKPLFQLSLKYKFFYLGSDELIQKHKSIGQSYRIYTEELISYIYAMFLHSVNKENMCAEPQPDFYKNMAEKVCMILHFYLQQERILGVKKHDLTKANKYIWELMIPHFTEKGLAQFKKLKL